METTPNRPGDFAPEGATSLGQARPRPCECGRIPQPDGSGYNICRNPACDGYGQICGPTKEASA